MVELQLYNELQSLYHHAILLHLDEYRLIHARLSFALERSARSAKTVLTGRC
mgnify:CR=1 FL=1